MPRTLWKGAITFGLVNIPVELYPAEDRKSFQFSMLDKRDLSPVGYKRYNKTTGKEVEWQNIVKGYEYEKDQYVVLSDEDFKRANVKATQTIDIRAFVGADEIAVEYFETPYYLAPDKRGAKVYALLRETLKSTQRIAVAQVVIRTTQHLAAVIPDGRALIMMTLRYQDELRPVKDLDLPPENLKAAGLSPKEIDLAKRLVGDMAEHWNPSEFKDTYHEDLMARIHEKIKLGQTKEITKPEAGERAAPRSAEVIDLAELLKQSLGKGGAERKPPARAEPKARGERNLRVVAGGPASGKRAPKTTSRTAARRKRA
ncbi:MAG TPA: Ku protein [Casimicrobiaceae bacterium]|nr:Ku protein [Casimicrobiaceae bacterium]